MKRRSYRVYALAVVLMVLGLVLQEILISGHLPFSQFVSIHVDAHSGLSVQIGYQPEYGGRDLHSSTEVRMLRPNFQTGMIFPQWGSDAYSADDKNWQIGLKDIQEQTGAHWIELPINLFQASITSTQVFASQLTPTPDAVVAGIQAAHARKFHVFVVPLLTVNEPDVLSWSGSIQFSTEQQAQAWFDSYWLALEPYVQAAAAAGAEQLTIGTELEKLQLASPLLWNQLIERIHSIYPGLLTYDMNWSSLYLPMPSWMKNPYLNSIGVSEYIPLTDTEQRLDPGVIPGLWKEKVGAELDAFALQLGKSVFISEIGYRNSAFALYRPWERDALAASFPLDPQEQAAAYDAALSDAIADPHISGIYFWAWSVPLFQPNWLPASKMLHKWYTSYLA